MSNVGQILAHYQATGLSLKGHPLESFRPTAGIISPQIQRTRIPPPAADLQHSPPDRKVRVAGIVLVRQHPGSARGITFATIEDETGTANLVIHPDVWNRFRTVARTASALTARGILQNESAVSHVVVDHLDDASAIIAGGRYQSRDFQ